MELAKLTKRVIPEPKEEEPPYYGELCEHGIYCPQFERAERLQAELDLLRKETRTATRTHQTTTTQTPIKPTIL